MAYPFASMPTLGEFVSQVQAHGWEKREFQGGLVGPRGPVNVRYLKSKQNVIVMLPPDISDDERLTSTVLRSLCNRTGIDPGHFGLILD